MSAMLEVSGLIKRFGLITAVDGISFHMERGEVLGFLGPNGAGKSTTMKMITGFLRPDSGSISVCDYDVVADPLAAKRSLGYLPEGAPLYPDMTPRQLLKFIAEVRELKGSVRDAAIERAISAVHIDGVLDQPIETLSKGFKRRVGLAQAILHDPPVLVLDEPTDGLDPNQKYDVRSLIKSMAPDKAIIISTHILEEVDAVCNRAMIIDHGRVVADGTPRELQSQSPYHNAVSIRVSAATADAARRELTACDFVAAVEQRGADAGSVHLIVLATNRAPILNDVGALAHGAEWEVDQLYVEPSRLDDVFRAITTGDADEGRA
jgi:ABC-2 type transport system ATP-binding protein